MATQARPSSAKSEPRDGSSSLSSRVKIDPSIKDKKKIVTSNRPIMSDSKPRSSVSTVTAKSEVSNREKSESLSFDRAFLIWVLRNFLQSLILTKPISRFKALRLFVGWSLLVISSEDLFLLLTWIRCRSNFLFDDEVEIGLVIDSFYHFVKFCIMT